MLVAGGGKHPKQAPPPVSALPRPPWRRVTLNGRRLWPVQEGALPPAQAGLPRDTCEQKENGAAKDRRSCRWNAVWTRGARADG